MSDLNSLIDTLNQSSTENWEDLYHSYVGPIQTNDLQTHVGDDTAFWVALRSDAGPPGTPLPEYRGALHRVLTGAPTTADIYVVMLSGPLPEGLLAIPDWTPHGFVMSCAVQTLGKEAGWLAPHLFTRAGFAALAAGDVKRLAAICDLLRRADRDPSLPRPLNAIAPLVDHPHLLGAPWARRFGALMWDRHGLPCIPHLESPSIHEVGPLGTFLAQLEDVGLVETATCLRAFSKVDRAYQAHKLEDSEAVKLIRSIHQGEHPESVLKSISPPEGLKLWIEREMSKGKNGHARLGALMLHSEGRLTPEEAMLYIGGAARSVDLPLLASTDHPVRGQALFQELLKACDGFPSQVVDAIISTTLPHHERYLADHPILATNLELLKESNPPEGSQLRSLIVGCERTERAALVGLEQLRALNRAAEAALDKYDRWDHLGSEELQRIAQDLAIPEDWTGIIEAAEREPELAPLPLALVFMALAGKGCENDPRGRVVCLDHAQLALSRSGHLNVRELRLLLLAELETLAHRAIWPRVRFSQLSLQFDVAKHLGSDEDLVDLREGARKLASICEDLEVPSQAIDAKVIAAQIQIHRFESNPQERDGDFVDAMALLTQLEKTHRGTELGIAVGLELVRQHTFGVSHPSRSATTGLALAAMLMAAELSPNQRANLSHYQGLLLTKVGHWSEARTCALEALENDALKLPVDVRGNLHFVIGHSYVLEGMEVPDLSISHLQQAIQYLRGVSQTDMIQSRLALAEAHMRRGEFDQTREALKQVEVLNVQVPSLQAPLHAIWGELLGKEGDLEEALKHFERGATIVPDEGYRVLFRLKAADLHRRLNGPDTERLEYALREFLDKGAETLEPSSEGLVEGLLASFDGQLSFQTLGRLIEWSRRTGRFVPEARLLCLAQKEIEAISVLRTGLQATPGPGVELSASHLLLCLMPKEEREESLRLIQRCEELLVEVRDSPWIRHDLAVSLQRYVSGDPDRARRCWELASSAAAELNGGSVEATSLSTAIKSARLWMGERPESDGEVVAIADWALNYKGSPRSEAIAPDMLWLVEGLLWPGPLTLPSVHERARQLLDRYAPCAGDEQGSALWARWWWIEGRSRGEVVSAPPTPYYTHKPPADDIPGWIVEVAWGKQSVTCPVEGMSESRLGILPVFSYRPELADSVLTALFLSSDTLNDSERTLCFEIIRLMAETRVLTTRNLSQLIAAFRTRAESGLDPALRALGAGLRKNYGPELDDCLKDEGDLGSKVHGHPSPPSGYDLLQLGIQKMQDARLQIAKQLNFEMTKPLLDASRELLSRAVEASRKANDSQILFHSLISLGNAYRFELLPQSEQDIPQAIQLYEQAAAIQIEEPGALGKLWKVQADAYRMRGEATDFDLAESLYKKALKERPSGFLRSETLHGLALLIRSMPGLTKLERSRRITRHLWAAIRADQESGGQALEFLLTNLNRWRGHHPDDPQALSILEGLKRRFPERKYEFELQERGLSSSGFSPELAEHLAEGFRDPNMSVFFQNISNLRRPDRTFTRLTPGMEAFFDNPETGRTIKYLAGDVSALRDLLAKLEAEDEEESQGGRMTARALVIRELAELGEVSREELRQATEVAYQHLQAVTNQRSRALLLTSLARLWSPQDHQDGKFRDFAYAVELNRESVKVGGGPETAPSDCVESLARGLLNMGGPNLHKNLEEAKHLYRILIRRQRVEGDAQSVANALNCLSACETLPGIGDPALRYRKAVELAEEAVQLAQDPSMKVEYMGSLAWNYTILSNRIGDEVERRNLLRKAINLYDEMKEMGIQGHRLNSYINNRAVAEATLLGMDGDHEGAIEVRRNALSLASIEESPGFWSQCAHNLANELFFLGPLSPERFAEAFTLSEECLKFRTIESFPRFYWETTHNLGAAILRCFEEGSGVQLSTLPWPPEEAWTKARHWFREALKATDRLGNGWEMATSALLLGRLALLAPNALAVDAIGDEAWKWLQRATPWLLNDEETQAKESFLALQLTHRLAGGLATEGMWTGSEHWGFALIGSSADRVLKWFLRAQAPQARNQRARLQRPPTIPIDLWLEWLKAHKAKDNTQQVQLLQKIIELEPDFLNVRASMARTEAWLRKRPGSIAVGFVPNHETGLAIILEPRRGKGIKASILGLLTPELSLPWDKLSEMLRNIDGAPEQAGGVIMRVSHWSFTYFTRPVQEFLGAKPDHVLFCPIGIVRLPPPALIWPSVNVDLTSTLDLPDLSKAPGRERSTLLFLADPGKGRGALGKLGLDTLRELNETAKRAGDVQIIASQGKASGQEILRLNESIRVSRSPASAAALMRSISEHKWIILIAHGRMDGLDDAALACVNAEGESVELSVSDLAADPDRLAGAVVFLLSCEGGNIGFTLHRTGGVAGALLAAGAKQVIAPLWPVRLGIARKMTSAALEALADGQSAAQALRTSLKELLPANLGPNLGGPPADPASKKFGLWLQGAGYVSWVG